jgi:hypothetical protein
MNFMRHAVALLASVTLLLPAASGAQTARNGNIYNGTAHEPSPGPVHSDEKAAGVALPPNQAEQQTNEVESLDKQLTEKADHDPAKNTPAPVPPRSSGR